MHKLILTQYVADAFTDKVFKGNPAAVCILEEWLPDGLMQDIAKENNLSETAFAVKKEGGYQLRWFTPGGEVDLCGHATLAAAFVLMNYYGEKGGRVIFFTRSGQLAVKCKGGLYQMDFPAYDLKPVRVSPQISAALGETPQEVFLGRDLLCVFEDEEIIKRLSPDMQKLRELDGLLLHATAPCSVPGYDCISRSFAPKLNVKEDPVCGSGHCHIAPYWARKLLRENITAYQASERGGTLYCQVNGDRVILGGSAALFCRSEIFLDL